MKVVPALAAALIVPLLACTTGATPPAVSVTKSLGTRQCDAGGATATAAAAGLADALRGGGVTVLAVACGSDGRMRAAMCGGADGRIAIIDVPAAQQAAATAQGFTPLAALPDARRVPCAPQTPQTP